MKQFDINKWLAASDGFARLEQIGKRSEDQVPHEFFQHSHVLQLIAEGCDELGLLVTKQAAERLAKRFEARDALTWNDLSTAMGELNRRLADEMRTKRFFSLDPSDVHYYDEPTRGWTDVIQHFPDAISDIEEASRCLALGRATACVFHLMRVMERGLRALSKSLGLRSRNPTWETILKKCDQELRKHMNDRVPLWQKDDQFFSAATANLRAVKDAWRNPTMHVRIEAYTLEQAEEVTNAVRAFMRHTATKLHG